jgi:hypothetical protein
VHIFMDNYRTHKTPLIWAWFAKRPRFHVHFTPTYGSWLNLVERWFAELTTKQLRRGVASERARARDCHPRVHRRTQRRRQALRLDQDRRRDPSRASLGSLSARSTSKQAPGICREPLGQDTKGSIRSGLDSPHRDGRRLRPWSTGLHGEAATTHRLCGGGCRCETPLYERRPAPVTRTRKNRTGFPCCAARRFRPLATRYHCSTWNTATPSTQAIATLPGQILRLTEPSPCGPRSVRPRCLA